jgi:uncharacterized repeat protein (TIGR01451 family)
VTLTVPGSAQQGTNFPISWTSTNADQVVSSSFACGAAAAGAAEVAGSRSVTCASTGTFTFSITVRNSGSGVTATDSKSITISAIPPVTLTVTKSGTGSGTVTSAPAGINCGGTCSSTYSSGTSVTLTAVANVGSIFTSWSGCDSTSGATCTVTMNANRTVTATFTSSSFTLTTSTSCSGANPQIGLSWNVVAGATGYTVFRNGSSYASLGNVTSYTDVAVTTGTSYSYFIQASNGVTTTNSNTQSATAPTCTGSITVNATLDGSAWTGAVSYTLLGPSTVNGASVNQTFTNQTPGSWTLSYNSGGPGGASFSNITPSATQSFGAGGSLTFSLNFTSAAVSVTLTVPASAQAGTSFPISWTSSNADQVTTSSFACGAAAAGAAEVAGSRSVTCASTGTFTFSITVRNSGSGVTATDSKSITISAIPPVTLTVTKSGTGSGTVTSAPAGINCGGTCSSTYSSGTSVTLTAVANVGSIFTSWSGCDSTSGATCTVTMNANRTVTATFTSSSFTLTTSTSCSGANPQIGLSWNVVAGATGYTVFRNGSSYASLGNVTSYTDVAVTTGTSYSYFIQASNGVTTTNSNTQSATAPTCTGSITVNATLDGSAWTGAVSYTLLGPSTVNGASVNQTFTNQTPGSWTLSYNSGGPGGASFSNITPSATQSFGAGGSLTFSLNFLTSSSGLTVIKSGSGSGTVTSAPAGINCGGTCSATFNNGTNVTLTAAAAGGSNFTSWSGCDSTSGVICNVTINSGRSVTAQFDLPAPTVTVSVPATAPINTNFTVSWTATNASGGSVVSSSFPCGSGPGPGSAQVSGSTSVSCATTGSKTFTIIVQNSVGQQSAPGSGTVVINQVIPNPPTNLQLDNASQCGQIGLTWQDNSNNEDGFHVWRYQAVGNPTLSYQGNTYHLVATLGPNVTTYLSNSSTDNPTPGNSYSYIVTSYNSAGDSSVSGQNAAGPVFVNQCIANLNASQKFVLRVNGSPYTNQLIKNGDTVTFRITIDNTQGTAPATAVYVVDTLSSNLQYVASSARLNANCVSSASGALLNSETVSGQTITWPRSGNNLGTKAQGLPNWCLDFNATVNSSSQQSIDFFQNSAAINFGGGPSPVIVKSPLTPIQINQAKVPTIHEVAP